MISSAHIRSWRSRAVFRSDMTPLLRPELTWDPDAALDLVLRELVARMPGDPWAGDGG